MSTVKTTWSVRRGSITPALEVLVGDSNLNNFILFRLSRLGCHFMDGILRCIILAWPSTLMVVVSLVIATAATSTSATASSSFSRTSLFTIYLLKAIVAIFLLLLWSFEGSGFAITTLTSLTTVIVRGSLSLLTIMCGLALLTLLSWCWLGIVDLDLLLEFLL